MQKISVIILHYKNTDDTFSCLKSLTGNNSFKLPFEIILVSNSGKIKDIQSLYPDIQYIENKVNKGFSGGVNTGIRKAFENGSSSVVLLNNDTILTYNSVLKFLEISESKDNLGICSPKIYFAPGFEYHSDKYRIQERGKIIWYAGGIIDWENCYASHNGVDQPDYGQHEKESETAFATGCMMLIKKAVIDKIGLFDENYFLYYEDVDYCMRAKKAGFKIFYIPQVAIWHKNASSSDKPGSQIHEYYQTRNRLYFGMKYASFKTKKSLIIESIRMMGLGGVKKQAVFDYYRGRMGERK
jgi:GT2 family glycosyltransferase